MFKRGINARSVSNRHRVSRPRHIITDTINLILFFVVHRQSIGFLCLSTDNDVHRITQNYIYAIIVAPLHGRVCIYPIILYHLSLSFFNINLSCPIVYYYNPRVSCCVFPNETCGSFSIRLRSRRSE